MTITTVQERKEIINGEEKNKESLVDKFFQDISKYNNYIMIGVFAFSILVLLIAIFIEIVVPFFAYKDSVITLNNKKVEIRVGMQNLHTNELKKQEKTEKLNVIKNKYKASIYTGKDLEDFSANNAKINAVVPEFNLEETNGNLKIRENINEINDRIKYIIERSKEYQSLNVEYIAYEYSKLVSLSINYNEDIGKKYQKTYVYSVDKQKTLTFEEYLKEQNLDVNIIKKGIERDLKLKNIKDKKPQYDKFLVDEYGNIIIFLNVDTYIYLNFR